MFNLDIKARQTVEVVPVSQLPFCRVAEPNPQQALWFWSGVRDSFRAPCIISNGQPPKLYLVWAKTAVLNVLQRPSGRLVLSQLWNVAVHIKMLVTGIGGNTCKTDPSERTATGHAQDHLGRLLNVLTAARKPGRFGGKEISGDYVLRLTAKATQKWYQNCVHVLWYWICTSLQALEGYWNHTERLFRLNKI